MKKTIFVNLFGVFLLYPSRRFARRAFCATPLTVDMDIVIITTVNVCDYRNAAVETVAGAAWVVTAQVQQCKHMQ